MGQDIHCAVELRQADGRWRFVGPLKLRRNRDTFRLLRGIPGDVLRGLPDDRDPRSCAQDAAECAARCWKLDHDLGEHSQSWATLAELRAVDWEATIVMWGTIPLRAVDDHEHGGMYETYASWVAAGGLAGAGHAPDGYCGWVSGGVDMLDLRGEECDREDVAELASPVQSIRRQAEHALRESRARRVVDLERARRFLADDALMPDPEMVDGVPRPRRAWAQVSWEEATRRRCAELYRWCVDRDREGCDGDAVRLVFGFCS
jgi:hypothetical protein